MRSVALVVALVTLVEAATLNGRVGSGRQAGGAPMPPARLATLASELGASAIERTAVLRVYVARDHALAWSTADGAWLPRGQALLERLHRADTDGLVPGHYLTRPLRAQVEGLNGAAGAWPRDVGLTLAALRYMRHLHLGRVDPRSLGLRLSTWAEPHDFATVLGEALARDRVADALHALAPPYVQYSRLVDALATYRRLAATTEPLTLPAIRVPVRPGDAFDHTEALAASLHALGDLPATVPAATARYEGTVVDGVRRFQARHGLQADGVLGRRTVEALRVPPVARVRQIEMALERLRWLPDLGDRRVVAVNIPMFRLWAWEAQSLARPPVLSMEVIVGESVRTETPVFVEALQHVVFKPYWNVPRSILHGEILPNVRRYPGYLARQQMEIVAGPGDDARVVPATGDAIDRLAAGALRLRQRPGPHNALGLVKFVFPNTEGVYMHGTPTPQLFARDRRDFSHGCIRVSQPTALAEWALAGVTDWDNARIAQAMTPSAPTSVSVALRAPIDVVLFYLTAAVLPEDGQLHFATDYYGHDAALARALWPHTAP